MRALILVALCACSAGDDGETDALEPRYEYETWGDCEWNGGAGYNILGVVELSLSPLVTPVDMSVPRLALLESEEELRAHIDAVSAEPAAEQPDVDWSTHRVASAWTWSSGYDLPVITGRPIRVENDEHIRFEWFSKDALCERQTDIETATMTALAVPRTGSALTMCLVHTMGCSDDE